jgi:glycosyltransferase involved in cell wall biosynthesis
MSCRKTVITADSEGMKEIALKELQFEAGNEKQLAEKINFFLENESEKKKLGLRSRKKIAEQYNIKNSAKEYLKLYSSLIC